MRTKILRTSLPPPGLSYFPQFISDEEEDALIAKLASLPFQHFTMLGYRAKRLVYSFGFKYAYEEKEVISVEPIPDWLLPLKDRCTELARLTSGDFEQVLIAQYPSGAAIGWHRDRPEFGASLAGVSLGAEATMRFRRTVVNEQELYKFVLNPRSAYVISGEARSIWQHSLAPVNERRYSITFRMLNKLHS